MPVTSAVCQNVLIPPIVLMCTCVTLVPLTVVKYSVVVKKRGLLLSHFSSVSYTHLCSFRILGISDVRIKDITCHNRYRHQYQILLAISNSNRKKQPMTLVKTPFRIDTTISFCKCSTSLGLYVGKSTLRKSKDSKRTSSYSVEDLSKSGQSPV